jgi:tetratricopeptide (TPR) repeat protein
VHGVTTLGRKTLAGATVAVLLLAAAWQLHRRNPPREEKRPRYIFINRTSRHDHDLALKLSLKLAEKRSGIENALVLLDKLPPNTTIEQAAERTFQRWQIGADRSGKGILYLYNEEENRFKIEVSYSLEGLFPDVVCHQLEEAARAYMLSEVPQDFLSELLITMNLHGQAASGVSLDLTPPAWTKSLHPSGGAGVQAQGYRRTFQDYQAAVETLAATDGEDYQPSRDPAETTKRYLRTLELGLGEPRLPLLTEGSGVFRMIVPRNGAQQRRILEYFRRAMPYQLSLQRDWGLVVFRPGVPNLPIVLRRSRDGLWFVDEPKSWTYFHRFEDSTDFVPKYDDLPMLRALRETRHPNASQPVYAGRVPTPAPPAYPFSLGDALRDLEEKAGHDPDGARGYARIGELYLFEMNWITEAIRMFEEAARRDPRRPEYHWRLYDLYLNNSEAEKMLGELRTLSELLPQDAQVKQWLEYYTAVYRLPPGEFFE